MKRLLTNGWNYVLLLANGMMAAKYWLLGYVLFILIPAAVLLIAHTQKSSQILEDEVTNTMLQTLKQASINLDFQFDSVRDTSNTLFMNPKLGEYLNRQATLEQQLEALKELRYLVDSSEANTNVHRVRLFVNGDRMFTGEKVNFFTQESLKNWPWYEKVMNSGGAIVWSGAYLESYIDRGPAYIFSAARMLRDLHDYDQISGVLLIDVAEKTITDILNKIKLTKEGTIYLLGSDGSVISHRDKSLLGKKMMTDEQRETIARHDEGVIRMVDEKDQRFAIYTKVASTGWKLVAEVPQLEISSRAVALNQFSGIATISTVTILFLLLVFILLAMIVRIMNRRIQTVIRTIKRGGIESLDDRALHAGGDFKLLENSVDHLIHRVHGLMEETYQSKVQEREAQLRALQAQINPHFLYNTLDTINWIAIGHNVPDISNMINGLAKYFRLSLNKGRDLVSVTDELNLAKVYLEIQLNRFPKSFQVVFDIEEGLEEVEMPKLTLQPIVENALLHGIRKSKSKTGTIYIGARKEEDVLILSVTDDGIGIEEELVQSLLTEPRPTMKSDGSGSSYGLYNVNERIKLFAGDLYGLQIQSTPGEGTTVTVRIGYPVS
ncbi:two-component system, sensor histidine kinase YesM [Paenibacillus sp. UNCCL117]|uniref:sensor histidine kinase n=1 Tax=unclassified Paenibacillus TaxID=185978 RepID=UPI0008846955|nr:MULTISPECIES: sensor histidine kinase [unclassified Paenibacillus]SDC16304.1 two-component system, sensor histidine kinase YesM [Paenibacillus sp. cl123]SFW17745.1 two-component system, sensor histidine kinase YesM [Paenibacillus sp. UNCCL117]